MMPEVVKKTLESRLSRIDKTIEAERKFRDSGFNHMSEESYKRHQQERKEIFNFMVQHGEVKYEQDTL